MQVFFEKTKHLFSEETQKKFDHIVKKGTSFSIRSRYASVTAVGNVSPRLNAAVNSWIGRWSSIVSPR